MQIQSSERREPEQPRLRGRRHGSSRGPAGRREQRWRRWRDRQHGSPNEHRDRNRSTRTRRWRAAAASPNSSAAAAGRRRCRLLYYSHPGSVGIDRRCHVDNVHCRRKCRHDGRDHLGRQVRMEELYHSVRPEYQRSHCDLWCVDRGLFGDGLQCRHTGQNADRPGGIGPDICRPNCARHGNHAMDMIS